MTPDELRQTIAFIERRVTLGGAAARTTIAFDAPAAGDLVAAGIAEDDARRLLAAPWWPEMVEEIVDTPAFCGEREAPETVLRYARDVVGEYFRKRYSPA